MLILTFLLSMIAFQASGDKLSIRVKAANNRLKKVSRIIGGENAPDGRYTFAQVSLQYPKTSDDDDAHECGGSLIAPDMILTAGHCKGFFSTTNLDRYNFDDESDQFWNLGFESMEVHPLYQANAFRYDFAVVKLKDVFPNATPVTLNRNASFPADGDRLTVLGWGTTSIAPFVYPDTLQIGHVFSMSNDACRNTVVAGQVLYKNEIFDEMLCAQRPGVDACAGDSGGPLIVEGPEEGLDVQVGLVSWGRGCAIYPGVYSRISSGYDWIRSRVCYHSVEPPSYMNCQLDERDPNSFNTNASQVASEAAIAAAANRQIKTPTQSPVAMTTPTPALTPTAAPLRSPAILFLTQFPTSQVSTTASSSPSNLTTTRLIQNDGLLHSSKSQKSILFSTAILLLTPTWLLL